MSSSIQAPIVRFTSWADEVEQDELEAAAGVASVPVYSTPVRNWKNKEKKVPSSPQAPVEVPGLSPSPQVRKVSTDEAFKELHPIVRCCVNGIPLHELEQRVQWSQRFADGLGPLGHFLTSQHCASEFEIDAMKIVRIKPTKDLFAALMSLNMFA